MDSWILLAFNDWEIESVERFLARLLVKVVVEEGEDLVCWLEAKRGTFFIRSLYSNLEVGRSEPFPYGIVWNAWVPPKVSLFTWEMTWGKTLTLDQLQWKG